MSRPLRIAIFLLCVALLPPEGPQAARAGFPVPLIDFRPQPYSCQRTDEAPVIDGLLEDSAWQSASWTGDFVDIEGSAKLSPRHRTRVKMAWDDQYFYVAARMGEPHVWASLRQRDSVIYHDNDFEVFIDPDGDNHLYYELEINALGTEWDLLLVKPYRDGGPAINAWDIQGLLTAVHVEGSLNDPSDQDIGWSVEIAIPWSVLAQCANRPAPPSVGDIWRVNFSRVQWRTRVEDGQYMKQTDPETGRSLPEDNWVWSPQGLIAMHYPEMWGQVFFADGSDLSSTAGGPTSSPEYRAQLIAHRLMEIYYLQKQWHHDHGRYAGSFAELGFAEQDLLGFALDTAAGDWELTLDSCAAGFVARLVSPVLTATVDHEGRLVRDPLAVNPPSGTSNAAEREGIGQ